MGVIAGFLMLSSTSVMAQSESGIASYYPRKWTGMRTASGEKLHHDSLTCAHRTLPFGTRLKVTNDHNGKSVFVRVNDRGPFVRGRIVDLSWAAARDLGIISRGVAEVTIEPAPSEHIPMMVSLEEYLHIQKNHTPRLWDMIEHTAPVISEPTWPSVP